MAYYNEFVYEVWFRDDAKSKAYMEDFFYTEEEAENSISKYKKDIEAHPNWGYGDDYEVYMVVKENPFFDFDKVLAEEEEDYYCHRN
jgi:hypothetical protein